MLSTLLENAAMLSRGEKRAMRRMAAEADRDYLAAILRKLVDACDYVKPFAGAVAVKASVKDIRQAGRFVKAVEKAKSALAQMEAD